MIEIINAGKTYKTKAEEKVALKNINLNFKNQGLVIITGESGSGKTTLMNCISGLDNFTEGSISGISRMDVAFVFQDYQLIEDLSIRDNLTIGMPVSNEEIHKVLLQVNLEDIDLNKKICHLSGGQKQRVSIARALLLNRRVIICDEPTGNLDKKTGTQIVQVLSTISKKKLVIVVTHNRSIFVEYADEFIHLQDGMIQSIEGEGTKEIELIPLPPTQLQLSWKKAISISWKRIRKYKGRFVMNCILLFISFLVFITSILFIGNNPYYVYTKYMEYYDINHIDFYYERMLDEFAPDPNRIQYSTNYIEKKFKNKDFYGERNISLAHKPTADLRNIFYKDTYFSLTSIYITDYFSNDSLEELEDCTIAISEVVAKSLFGNEDPLGKIVTINRAPCVISKIIPVDLSRFDFIAKRFHFKDELSNFMYCNQYTFAYLSTYGSLFLEARLQKDILGNSYVYKDQNNLLKENEIILPKESLAHRTEFPLAPEEYLGKEIIIPMNISNKIEYIPFLLKAFGNEATISKKKFFDIGMYEYDAYAQSNGKYGVSYQVFPSKEKCKELDSKGYTMTCYLSKELKETHHYVESRSKILTFSCLGAVIIIFLFNIFLVLGATESKQREVGILCSMGFKMRSIFKLFIFESTLPLFTSVIVSLCAVPFLLLNINYHSEFIKLPFLYFNFWFVILLICLSCFLFGIYFLYLYLNYRRKTTIELVYEK